MVLKRIINPIKKLNATEEKMEKRIVRNQFTRRDEELHPECANKEYLEYKMMNSNQIIAHGYQEIVGTKYQWIKLSEREEMKNGNNS